ncbi:hypothetical protein [Nocardioides sp. CFH 31398]|uniref:hypothetical protein n=1 Tax=Nocardioides sp. CFH 31398 TaxID=2919579 RepID=UPI001F05E8C2|nr:hypothetical protein [Nocardioides sp. CFH 31398]MCH1867464.1 hypothetical protein [Nocardioides sp. CFH 31398]
MTLRQLPLVAALTAVALFALKSVAIAVTGEPYGTAAGVLFYPGLLAAVVAAVAAGLALGAGRGLPARAGLVLGCLAVAAVAAAVGDVVGRAVVPSTSWVAGEVNLWVMGAVLVVLAAAASRRARGASVRAGTVSTSSTGGA